MILAHHIIHLRRITLVHVHIRPCLHIHQCCHIRHASYLRHHLHLVRARRGIGDIGEKSSMLFQK